MAIVTLKLFTFSMKVNKVFFKSAEFICNLYTISSTISIQFICTLHTIYIYFIIHLQHFFKRSDNIEKLFLFIFVNMLLEFFWKCLKVDRSSKSQFNHQTDGQIRQIRRNLLTNARKRGLRWPKMKEERPAVVRIVEKGR